MSLIDRLSTTRATATTAHPEYDENLGWMDIKSIRIVPDEMPARDHPVVKERIQVFQANGQDDPLLVHREDGGRFRLVRGVFDFVAAQVLDQQKVLVRVVEAENRVALRFALQRKLHTLADDPVARGANFREYKQDMIDELNQTLASLGGAATGFVMNEQEYERLLPHFPRMPVWVQHVIQRAWLTKRRPRVLEKDLAEATGYTERMIRYYLRIHEMARKDERIAELSRRGKLNTGHLRALTACTDPSERETLLQTILNEGVSGNRALEHARATDSPLELLAEAEATLVAVKRMLDEGHKFGVGDEDAFHHQVRNLVERAQELVGE